MRALVCTQRLAFQTMQLSLGRIFSWIVDLKFTFSHQFSIAR